MAYLPLTHTHTHFVDMRNFGIVFYSIHMSLLVRMWKYMWTVECRCCNMFKLSCIVEVNPFYCYSTLSIELRASIHSLIQLSLTHTQTHISLCACMKWQSLTKSKTTMAHSGGKFLCHFCHWVFGSQTDGTLCVCVCSSFNLSFVPNAASHLTPASQVPRRGAWNGPDDRKMNEEMEIGSEKVWNRGQERGRAKLLLLFTWPHLFSFLIVGKAITHLCLGILNNRATITTEHNYTNCSLFDMEYINFQMCTKLPLQSQTIFETEKIEFVLDILEWSILEETQLILFAKLWRIRCSFPPPDGFKDVLNFFSFV